MRKSKLIIIAVIFAITALFSAIAWAMPKGETGNTKNTIEIRERMFATQVSDIYLNADDYLGKTIKLEGIFKKEQWDETGQTYCYVVRYGPGGCCGLDANVGFEVAWANDRARAYPDSESWVEATGVLKILEELEEDEDSQYLYLDLSSLNVLSKRGAETVRQ